MSYKTGRIYRIICLKDPEFQYVGSTFNELRHRWQNHKQKYKFYLNGKTKMRISAYDSYAKYGIENFKIILIKEYKVCDRTHLEAYETLWINKVKCVNKYKPFFINYLSKKEYYEKNKNKKKDYYERNKEEISKYQKEYQKEYRKKNKEELAEKKKEYRKKNKEELAEKKKEYNKEKYTCACGTTLTKNHKIRHEKSKKHLNFISSINK